MASHTPTLCGVVHQLVVKPVFDAPEPREKLYAHFMARAAWYGSRIWMRQDMLVTRYGVLPKELDTFQGYATTFLCNLGNYYGEGDQKFVPDLSAEALHKIAAISPKAKDRLRKIIGPLENAQSAYYPGTEHISHEEIAKMSKVMEQYNIGPENTRVRKLLQDGKPVDQLLQASAEISVSDNTSQGLADGIVLVKRDYSEELSKVCLALKIAEQHTSNSKQLQFLTHYIECFRTASLEAFQEVEHLIGFIESYRDPAGIRSEWEAMIGIADPGEASRLKRLVESSTAIICHLSWAVEGVNDDKGLYEKSLFEAFDFTSVHALAVCGSIVFEAANLPNEKTCGFKNVVLTNRLTANNPKFLCDWVNPSEVKQFKEIMHIVRYVATAIHELLGHVTGKPLSESAPGTYNFNKKSPPISPITGELISSHYLPGQTWGSIFGKLAEITSDDRNLEALEHYNIEIQSWGQVHHQAHFSILKHLQDGGDVIRIDHDPANSSLTVHVDRNKFTSHGKPALGRYLCDLYIWRCTADVAACKELYEPLCAVDGEDEQWKQIVCSKPKPRWKFVQPNTFVNGDVVEMKVYEERNK
ncbi:dipeptidyl peptidase III [Podospora didyma]|uniref:Dipeptidyl peptidase III n=1 Tax=Podospora didyma TaxID=330526 RepID=A0AAE0NY54_9PEZI|nr:dipeptidyl peptidase III [Podospora didyma]